MTKFLSLFVLLVTLFGAGFSQEIEEYMKIKVEFEMPIVVVDEPDGEPAHGTCYNNTALLCPLSKIGVFEANPVNPCLDCVCTEQQVYYCCRRVAEPKVNDPEKCKLKQHQETCEFKLPKCKKCKILGWYTTELDDDLEKVFA